MNDTTFRLAICQSISAVSATAYDANGTLVTRASVPYERDVLTVCEGEGKKSSDSSAGAYAPRVIIDDMCEVVMNVLGVSECEPGAQPQLTTTVKAAEVGRVSFVHDPDDVIVWDISDGLPVYEALSTGDMRGAEIASRISQTLGCSYAPDCVAARIVWVLENVEGARAKADRGELLCGDPTCWMVWNLSGGVEGLASGVTSFSTTRDSAEKTGLFDSVAGTWSETICAAVGIPLAMLPEIKESSEFLGQCRGDGVLPGVPIVGGLPDILQ